MKEEGGMGPDGGGKERRWREEGGEREREREGRLWLRGEGRLHGGRKGERFYVLQEKVFVVVLRAEVRLQGGTSYSFLSSSFLRGRKGGSYDRWATD